MGQIVEHPDGVYLNLTEESYYVDWAVGGTSLTTLKTSPPDWWWESPFNELVPPKAFKDEDATKAQLFGSAVHICLLEGVDVFQLAHAIAPDKYSHPRALDTADKIKERLKELSEKVTGAKPELIERLLGVDPSAQILDVIIEEAKSSGRKLMSKWDYQRILLMERTLMGPPAGADGVRKLTGLGKAFQGGLSEVSVFWTEERGGVKIRQRARFDKLKPNVTIDLKTYSNWRTRDFDKAMLRDAALKGYHVQWAHYEAAREQLRRLVAEGKVFAPRSDNAELQAKINHDIELLKTIAAAEKWKWTWVFYKTDGAPRAKGVVVDRKGEFKGVYDEGCAVREEALNNFVHYHSFFGLSHEGMMWRDPDMLWEPAATDWPSYAQQVD